MKSNKDYKPEGGFSLLLQGIPKTGKTCLAMQFPKPWFLQADRNMQSAVSLFPDKEFFYDYVDVDDNGKEVPATLRWKRIVQLTKAALIDPNVKTIVIDSLTPVDKCLQDHLVKAGGAGKKLTIGGVDVMDLSLWNPYKHIMTEFINMLKLSDKYIIVICHERDQLDSEGSVIGTQPNVGGQLRGTIPYLFTDVWQTSSKRSAGEVRYIINTKPMARNKSLTSSTGMPDGEPFDWDTFEKLIPGGTQ